MLQLIHGDCLDVLRTLPDGSVDSLVTDPPAFIDFMGKKWDGTDHLWKYLWSNTSYVKSVVNALRKLRVESGTVEASIAQDGACTPISVNGDQSSSSARSAAPAFEFIDVQTSVSVPLLALTGREVLGLLSASSCDPMPLEAELARGGIADALFAIPLSLPAIETTNTVPRNVTTSIKSRCSQAREIQVTSTGAARIRDVIEVLTGHELEKRPSRATSGPVSIVESQTSGERFSAITLSHGDSPEITASLTLLLCALVATEKSRNIPSYLASNFMECVLRECLRVLKPGAHGLVWALPRTSHWTATACEDAGFEVRDVVTHLFGSGFPKSLSVDKAIGKWKPKDVYETAPATDAAKQWQGFGTALKPASEHWILIRKPLGEKTVAANVLKHGCGALNIDASRIGTGSESQGPRGNEASAEQRYTERGSTNFAAKPGPRGGSPTGRFPANLVFSHQITEILRLKREITPGVTKLIEEYFDGYDALSGLQEIVRDDAVSQAERETLDGTQGSGTEACCTECRKQTLEVRDPDVPQAWLKYFEHARFVTCSDTQCTPGCAVAELDRQSGVSKSGSRKAGVRKGMGFHGADGDGGPAIESSTGSASRFFYCAKISKAERNSGLEDRTPKKVNGGRQTPIDNPFQCGETYRINTHPTVKPKRLMEYLIRMVTPPKVVELTCIKCNKSSHGGTPKAENLSELQSQILLPSQDGEILLSPLQGSGPAAQAVPLSDLSSDSTKGETNLLLTAMSGDGGSNAEDAVSSRMPELPADVHACAYGQKNSGVLRSDVLGDLGRGTEARSSRGECCRVSPRLCPKTSECWKSRDDHGTPSNSGEPYRATTQVKRGSSSHQRNKGRQPRRELGINGQENARPSTEGAAKSDCMSALQKSDSNEQRCSKCNGDLIAVDRPGTVLDPFCGSGSTGVAAVGLGFGFIGIEKESEYLEISKKRIEHASKGSEPKKSDPSESSEGTPETIEDDMKRFV